MIPALGLKLRDIPSHFEMHILVAPTEPPLDTQGQLYEGYVDPDAPSENESIFEFNIGSSSPLMPSSLPL